MLNGKPTLRNQLLAGVLAVWMLLCAIPQPILAAAGDALAEKVAFEGKSIDSNGEPRSFKLLLIGNSYSEDASSCGQGMRESQLLDILQAMLGDDVQILVGLAYSGGKGLNWHATQADQEKANHSLYVINSGGEWTSKGRMVLRDALEWADWDVVSLQHYGINVNTGEESVPYPEQTDPKFYKLETAAEYLLDYVDMYAPQADAYFYMHWAQTSSIKPNAAKSTYDSRAAYLPVVLDYAGTESGKRFADLIPVGLSVQNARTTYLSLLAYNTTAYADKNLNLYTDAQIGLQRDGGHLSFNIGRYIAGLTFAESIIPEELRQDNYTLPDIRVTESVGKLPKEYTVIAQKAVHAAVESWKNGSLAVTEIEGYTEDPTVAAGKFLAETTVKVPCGASIDAIKAAMLAVLPADFAIESVTLPNGTVPPPGEAFDCDVTIRFGYTFLTVSVRCTVDVHKYVPNITPPTCTEQGYTSHTCTCGDSYVDSYVPATGHTYENGACASCGKEMLRITKSDLVQYQGGVNSLNGTLNTTFTNNWYSDIRIPKGAQQVRYLTFKTGGDWGVAFLQDGVYLSGACDKTTGGQWVTADIPAGATTFRYGYLYDAIAAQNGLPAFEYVEFIGEDLEQWEESDYLPRPATGCHSFSVEVNIAPAQGNPNGYVKGTDYGYIQLPTNYSAYGEPTRLIIACHGAGASLSTYKSSAWKNTNYSFWTDLGYAVMDMYASPQELTGSDSALHYGNPVVLECYKKGYDYVMQHFNLKQDGIFLIGASMGGLSSFQIAQSGQFPVIAQVAYCPVIDLFKQAYCNPWTTASYQRSHIASYFGFTGTAPAFTNNRYPSLQEIEFFRQNSDKVTAYSPILRNVIAGNIASLFDVVPSSPTAASAEEAALYAGLTATHPNPLMVFHNTDDSTVAYRYSQYFVEMVNRSGQEAILRTFTSGNHNAWANGASKTVQGLNGTITIKESQYEAYLFFDKFEQHETHCAWTDPAKAPTCDQTGLTQGSHCAVCGEVLQKQETVPATGHKFSVYTTDGNATYEADGTKTALCDHGCGAKDTVADVGSMLFPEQVTSTVYTISDGVLSKVLTGTTVSQLLSGLDWGKCCTVFDTNGKAVEASAKVATGMVVKLLRDSEVKQTLTIAVCGDTNGDGTVTLTDFVQIQAHLLQKQTLTGAAVKAADYSADGSVTVTDFMQVKALLLQAAA